jgi:hypothetical protein
MSLPEPWVNKIFDKLALTYGAAFLRTYDGLELADVKGNWGHELSVFQQNPASIAYALDNLPPAKPPTVLQFRDLCRMAPAKEIPQVAGPAATPEQVARVVEAAKALVNRQPGFKPSLQWAIDLQERERRSPDGMTQFQRDAWRDALKVGRGEPA